MASESQVSFLTVSDLIQKSKLISEGPPARYRLLTTRSNLDEKGSVRKWTFGQRDNKMQNKILLMVGETGTGKTTLINAMVNYILGVKYEDDMWFEIIEDGGDNDKLNQSRSQTGEITVYEVFPQYNSICLTLIDTPGYGSTMGTEYDEQVAENLCKLFHSDSGVKEIDAVCLVVKASENRLSDRQKYVFDAVLSLFGKNIENNIFILITHSDGLPPEDARNAIKEAKIPYRKDEENEPEHFLFNNRQTAKRNEKSNKILQTAWELTEDSLKDFFDSLKEQNRKSLEQTESVLSECKRIKACIFNLQNRIEFIECKSKELDQIQKVVEENREKIKKNENFSFPVTEYNKEKVPIENASRWNRKATTCSVCEENCHEYNCWLAFYVDWCEVFKNGHCTSCTGKCHYTKHVRENNKYVTSSREITMTFDDLKKQYESNENSAGMEFDTKTFENVKKDLECNKKQKEEKTNIEKKLKEDIDMKTKEKSELVEEASTIIIKLSEIALKSDSAFIIQALDFLIPRAEETGKTGLAQKLGEMRKIQPESEETVHAVMKYASASWSKIKSLIPGKK